jgi:tetratricopeptide (TPR) repeat protein
MESLKYSFRRTLRLAIVLAALAATASPVWGDYRSSYAKGITAMDRQEWNDAIRWFREAAQENPKEGGRVLIYGLRYREYLPHYYLGVALFRSKNCEAALEAWARSEEQGLVRRMAEYRQLTAFRQECQGRTAPERGRTEVRQARLPSPQVTRPPAPSPVVDDSAAVARALREAESELARTESAAASGGKLRRDPGFSAVWRMDPALRERESSASKSLARARVLLNEAKAKRDLAASTAARDTAIRARQEFESLQGLAISGQRRVQKVSRELAAGVTEARGLLAGLGRDRPAAPQTQKAKAELEVLLREAGRSGSSESVAELERLRDRIGVSLARLKGLSQGPDSRIAAKPPVFLLEAASAYFQGDYDKTVATLEKVEVSDRRVAAQVSLFRSAARYGLYVTRGESDRQLRDRAAADAKECLRIDPGLAISTRAFSPRFIDFFKRSGSGRASS